MSSQIQPHKKSYQGILALLLCAGIAAVVAVSAVPFSAPMPDFWDDAAEFAAAGRIRSVFTPNAYPALLGIALRLGGKAGVFASQIFLYLAIVVSVYLILRLLRLDDIPAALGAGFIGLYPDLLVSIKKIWDTEITAALLMLAVLAALAGMRRGFTPFRASVLGVLWGCGMAVRPNFPALLLPFIFAFWFSFTSGNKRAGRLMVQGAFMFACAATMLAALSVAAHGSFYVPQNGPYNFFAGENAFTERALLTSLNAEPSIYPALRACGLPADVDVYNPDLRPYYVRHALLYIREQPGSALRLVFLKLATLLRPDTKIHPLRSWGGMIKLLEALAVPVWLLSLIVSRSYGWRHEDWLFVLFVIAYITPFLLTNADPRFRVALDILVLTHAIYRIHLCLGAALSPSRPAGIFPDGVESPWARVRRRI